MEQYLAALKKGNLQPNFFCSNEYAKHAGWVEHITNNIVFVHDDEGAVVLPPLCLHGSFAAPRGFDIWADLAQFPGFISSTKEFLDYEYLFQAKAFQTMEGGNWSVFRKNSRKWPTRIAQEWEYRELPIDFPIPRLEALLIDWLGGLDESEHVHGTDTLLSYLRTGSMRWGLFTKDGRLHAVNIADYNWKYINYRYCICSQQPFLSEFVRLLFYQDIYRRCGDVTVNDGGCLDRISLKEFKDRLNPLSVRKVFSWKSK